MCLRRRRVQGQGLWWFCSSTTSFVYVTHFGWYYEQQVGLGRDARGALTRLIKLPTETAEIGSGSLSGGFLPQRRITYLSTVTCESQQHPPAAQWLAVDRRNHVVPRLILPVRSVCSPHRILSFRSVNMIQRFSVVGRVAKITECKNRSCSQTYTKPQRLAMGWPMESIRLERIRLEGLVLYQRR